LLETTQSEPGTCTETAGTGEDGTEEEKGDGMVYVSYILHGGGTNFIFDTVDFVSEGGCGLYEHPFIP